MKRPSDAPRIKRRQAYTEAADASVLIILGLGTRLSPASKASGIRRLIRLTYNLACLSVVGKQRRRCGITPFAPGRKSCRCAYRGFSAKRVRFSSHVRRHMDPVCKLSVLSSCLGSLLCLVTLSAWCTLQVVATLLRSFHSRAPQMGTKVLL